MISTGIPDLQTIIFDLDGTLIHSSPDIAAALNTALAAHGKELSVAEVEDMIGGGLPTLLTRALAHFDLKLSKAEARHALDRMRAAYRAAPATRPRRAQRCMTGWSKSWQRSTLKARASRCAATRTRT